MIGAAGLLLLTLTAPQIRLFAAYDLPAETLHRGETGGATVIVTVDPAGRTLGCERVDSYGSPALGATICDLLLHRRFEPARLADGTRAYARVRKLLRFDLLHDDWDRMPQAALAPDMVMHDHGLPAAAEGKSVEVVLAVDGKGAVTDCAGVLGQENHRLAARVCIQSAHMGLPVLTLPDGRTVPHVTTRTVRLTRGD
jgi:hypothetical protein